MKRVTWLIFLSAFLLLRPYNFSTTGQMYSGDDWSYFAHASALAFGEFPSYSKESWMTGEGVPSHSVGAGVLAAPFVYLFSRLDLLNGNDIVSERKPNNIPGSWALFGFVVASSVYFWLACLFLFLSARMFVSSTAASWAVIGMVLVQGAPLFIFRRPVFSHVYELVLLAFLVWLFCRVKQAGAVFGRGSMLVAGIAGGLLSLTRLDDLGFVLGFQILFVWQMKGAVYRKALALGLMVFLGALVVAVFKVWPEMLVAHHSLHGVDNLMKHLSVLDYMRRLWHIIVGPDWGLVFTAPFILVTVVFLYTSANSVLVQFKWISVLLLIKLWVVMQWMTQGGWYGYRYLLLSAMALLTVPFAVFLEEKVLKGALWRRVAVVLIALPPLLSMLFFEGNAEGLTLHIVEQYFAVSGWGNNIYQWEVWRALLWTPLEAVMVLCKGGVLYFFYLFCQAFSLDSVLPIIVRGKYPSFQWVVLVKTILVYVIPFVLFLLWQASNFKPGRKAWLQE
ncbi:MAG: hypothetical protein HQL20_00480 [Candidatus Omnitrophica bacterium]|nr:hypothetical protein [Candidatus Omnitrophota bacterium]